MNTFKKVVFSILILASTLFLISFTSTLLNVYKTGVEFCVSSHCILNFLSLYKGSLEILKISSYILGIFTTIYGVYIALNGYLNNVKSTALAGYIGHLSLFKDYIKDETEKLKGVNISGLDIHTWYGLAFPNAKNGDITESTEYRHGISKIVSAIESTNSCFRPPGGEYDYKKHQDKIIQAFREIGINMGRMPKNDFIAVEGEVIALLDAVNRTFTNSITPISKTKRLYI